MVMGAKVPGYHYIQPGVFIIFLCLECLSDTVTGTHYKIFNISVTESQSYQRVDLLIMVQQLFIHIYIYNDILIKIKVG